MESGPFSLTRYLILFIRGRHRTRLFIEHRNRLVRPLFYPNSLVLYESNILQFYPIHRSYTILIELNIDLSLLFLYPIKMLYTILIESASASPIHLFFYIHIPYSNRTESTIIFRFIHQTSFEGTLGMQRENKMADLRKRKVWYEATRKLL